MRLSVDSIAVLELIHWRTSERRARKKISLVRKHSLLKYWSLRAFSISLVFVFIYILSSWLFSSSLHSCSKRKLKTKIFGTATESDIDTDFWVNIQHLNVNTILNVAISFQSQWVSERKRGREHRTIYSPKKFMYDFIRSHRTKWRNKINSNSIEKKTVRRPRTWYQNIEMSATVLANCTYTFDADRTMCAVVINSRLGIYRNSVATLCVDEHIKK